MENTCFEKRINKLLKKSYSNDMTKAIHFNLLQDGIKFNNLKFFDHNIYTKIFYIEQNSKENKNLAQTYTLFEACDSINIHISTPVFCGLSYVFKNQDLSFYAFGRHLEKALKEKGFFNTYKNEKEQNLIEPLYLILKEFGFEPLITKTINENNNLKIYEVLLDGKSVLRLDNNGFKKNSVLNKSLSENILSLTKENHKDVFTIEDVRYYFQLLKILSY